MNKRQFITYLSKKMDCTYFEAALMLDKLTSSIEEILLSGSEVNIQGFGKFAVTKRVAKKGVNPRTLESINIDSYSTPVFRAGTTFKKVIRSQYK